MPAQSAADVEVRVTSLYTDGSPMPLGTYTATLFVLNDDPVSQTQDVVVVMHVISGVVTPSASFDSSSPVCLGTEMVFTDTSGHTPTSWEWDLGDGITDTVTNPVHTYAAAGTYTVTLLASGDCGSDPYSAPVTVAGQCLPAEILTVTTDISGCLVAFGAEVTGTVPYEYLWDFSTLGTSTATNPLVDFGASGTYPYTLTLSNCGPQPAAYTGSVTVDCTPVCEEVAVITVTREVELCTVTFTPQLTGTVPFTYLWAFGDGMTSTLPLPTHTYTQTGTYNITLDVWNCSGAGHDVRTFPVAMVCQPTYSIYLPLAFR